MRVNDVRVCGSMPEEGRVIQEFCSLPAVPKEPSYGGREG